MSKIKITYEGQPCRKCQTPVIKKIPKNKKDKSTQAYYYKYYFFCPGCKAMYMVESAKVEPVGIKPTIPAPDNYLGNYLGANVETTCGKKGLIHRDQHEDGRYWVYPYRSREFEPGLYDYTIISYYG